MATPVNKAGLERHYDKFLGAGLNRCTTCHQPSDKKDPQSLDEFPHNVFGDRLRKLGEELEAASTFFDAIGGFAFVVGFVEVVDGLFDGFGGIEADDFGEFAGGEGKVGGEEDGLEDLGEGHGVGGEVLPRGVFGEESVSGGRRGLGGGLGGSGGSGA